MTTSPAKFELTGHEVISKLWRAGQLQQISIMVRDSPELALHWGKLLEGGSDNDGLWLR